MLVAVGTLFWSSSKFGIKAYYGDRRHSLALQDARARWLSISLICCPFRKLTTMSASMLILLIAFLFALLPLAHTQTCRARRHDGGKRCGGNRMPTPRHLPPTTLRGPRKTLQNCLGSKVWPSHGKVSLMRVRIACRSALPALQHCLPFTH